MDSTYVQYIVDQTNRNIAFLLANGHVSRVDADLMQSKLPAVATATADARNPTTSPILPTHALQIDPTTPTCEEPEKPPSAHVVPAPVLRNTLVHDQPDAELVHSKPLGDSNSIVEAENTTSACVSPMLIVPGSTPKHGLTFPADAEAIQPAVADIGTARLEVETPTSPSALRIPAWRNVPSPPTRAESPANVPIPPTPAIENIPLNGYSSKADAESILSTLPNGATVTAEAQSPTNVRILPPPIRRSVPAPPPRSKTVQARVLWAYVGDGPCDLTLAKGDIVEITEETNADWWTGCIGTRQGLFPSDYVEKLSLPQTEPTSTPETPTIPTPPPQYTVNEKKVYKPYTGAAYVPPAASPTTPVTGSGRGNNVRNAEETGQEQKMSKMQKFGIALDVVATVLTVLPAS
ncbi:hypothetical protein BD410DRAFT_832056 [Rickenella mellea]|uniref:SH3 domain-containing protein n=1 Tax=Rickenella mellea TaxID=50990 RepID=A0A4Y7PN79_9AGAM|nr:hypothetical protein BD410DRAFT_832056 [Rickenella mellea]